MWLAVLVPMWLKSYDSGANLSSVDRFSDAMRVLSRRHVAMTDRRTLLMPPRPRAVLSGGPGPQPLAATERAARIEAALARTVPSGSAPGPRAEHLLPQPGVDRPSGPAEPPVAEPPALDRPSPAGRLAAARRLRTLRVLLGAAGLTLLLAMVGPGLLLALHLLVDALLVGFVAHCRRLAVLRAGQAPSRREATAPVRAEGPAARSLDVQPAAAGRLATTSRTTTSRSATSRTAPSIVVPAFTSATLQPLTASAVTRPAPTAVVAARVAGIPDLMPSRPAALTSFVPAQSARRADEIAARPVTTAALVPAASGSAASVHGEPWSPVPVPVPIYVTMPAAPPAAPPAARVVDLTHPGKWSDTLADGDDGLHGFADDAQLDEIAGRRRAAGDW